jgi:hypothetical protein
VVGVCGVLLVAVVVVLLADPDILTDGKKPSIPLFRGFGRREPESNPTTLGVVVGRALIRLAYSIADIGASL